MNAQIDSLISDSSPSAPSPESSNDYVHDSSSSSGHSLDLLVTRYLEYCELEKNMTQSSLKMYHYYLGEFSSWVREFLKRDDIYIEDINPELIRAYRLHLNRRKSQSSKEELKRVTQITFLVALRAFLRYLIVEQGLEVPAPEQILLGKADPRVPKVLNEDQLKRLLEVQNIGKRGGLRDHAILETLFSTGMRVSELVGLNRDDVNLDSGEFTVIGKGRKARTVYLSPTSIYWLKRYLLTRKDPFRPLFLRYAGKKMPDDDLEGESLRLTVRSVQRIVKKYATKAGISVDATPHTLRHTFATGLLREGADLRSVQELLGHSNVSTTQIYTHVTNKELRDTHKRFHHSPSLSDSDANPGSKPSLENDVVSDNLANIKGENGDFVEEIDSLF